MAEQAVKLGASHPHIEFEAASLKAIVAPDSSKDPSGWISQLWKDLEKNQERWAQGMTETAKVMGLDFAPLLMKVPGSPAKYQLLAKPVGETASESEPWTVPPGGLRYTPAAVAAPGAMINATLRRGVVSHVLPLVIFAVVCLVVLACLVLVV